MANLKHIILVIVSFFVLLIMSTSRPTKHRIKSSKNLRLITEKLLKSIQSTEDSLKNEKDVSLWRNEERENMERQVRRKVSKGCDEKCQLRLELRNQLAERTKRPSWHDIDLH